MSSFSYALGPYQNSPLSWYRATSSELRQREYAAPWQFDKEPDISFLEVDGNPIPLREMLDQNFYRPEWDCCWTESRNVGQKISIRVNLLENPYVKAINARRETQTREPISKNKLARLAAQATAEALRSYFYRMGGQLDDFTLVGLRHVAQGSWQPIIYVRNRS